MEADSLTQDLQEVLADLWGEHGRVLLLDGRRLVDLELAFIVQVDQGVVGIGQSGGRTCGSHHRL